ncbi:hypothetical protein [Leptospira barantonii]|uniref:Histidine kinase n=1 Tax=Leptospira barantonii TaxID=2023184 RepID=A0ABX4NIM0_9LEPT|nr:hypothetical protein [Leptospira barantonii]PJZ56644.1 hypothetical protein CH367_14435 [Leptospira barantonii]
MYETNVELLGQLIQEKRKPYAILSLIQDTIDSMRTDVEDVSVSEKFYEACLKISEAIVQLDSEISK